MFRLPPPAPVHVDLDTSFPRTDWGEWEYGPPPYGDRLDDSRVLWAGREASRAFAAALVPGGSWKDIDPTCFKLAVYDKANALREAWRDGQTGDVFETHREWKASLPRFVRMAYESAKRTVLSANPNVDQTLFGRYDEIEDFCLRGIDLGCPTGSDTWAFDPDLTPILGPELGRWDADLAFERGQIQTVTYSIPLSDFDDAMVYTGGDVEGVVNNKRARQAEAETSKATSPTIGPPPAKARRTSAEPDGDDLPAPGGDGRAPDRASRDAPADRPGPADTADGHGTRPVAEHTDGAARIDLAAAAGDSAATAAHTGPASADDARADSAGADSAATGTGPGTTAATDTVGSTEHADRAARVDLATAPADTTPSDSGETTTGSSRNVSAERTGATAVDSVPAKTTGRSEPSVPAGAGGGENPSPKASREE